MNNIFDYELDNFCCGCRVCEYSCIKKCITCEQSSSDGFIYPVFVNRSNCIDCGKCIKVCPIINNLNGKAPLNAARFTSNLEISSLSASGGVFATIAHYYLNNKGIVYGCCLNENLDPVTERVDKEEDLPNLLSSKYVQCNTNNKYISIKEDLIKGKKVVYCSTPCQVAALKNYLGTQYENLLTIDLFCHGVPSPGLFKKYVSVLEKRHHCKISKLVFRDKSKCWGTAGYYIADRKRDFDGDEDPYYYNFIKTNIYQKVCYKCPYAQMNRVGDLSIGDFWGIEEEYPQVDTSNGVSAVLINSNKGEIIIESVAKHIEFENVDLDTISKHNHVLCYPTPYNRRRDQIYSAYGTVNSDILFKDYVNLPYTRYQRIKKRAAKALNRHGFGIVVKKYCELRNRGEDNGK